jgi:hypothetical protein
MGKLKVSKSTKLPATTIAKIKEFLKPKTTSRWTR